MAVAAPPTNANIQVGTSSTNSVPNLKIDVATVGTNVVLTYKVGGVQGLSATSGSVTGTVTAGSDGLLKAYPLQIASATTEAIYNAPGGSANTIDDDSGLTATNASFANFGSNITTTGAGAGEATFAINSLGGYTGLVSLCVGMRYSFSSEVHDLVHCSSSFNWPALPDTQAPVLANARIQADGNSVLLTFDEGMSAAVSPSGFSLTKNGTAVNFTPGNISAGGNTLTLTLATTVLSSEIGYRLAYTPGGLADDASTPNALGSIVNFSVQNQSTQTSASSGSSGNSTPGSQSNAPKYSGPEFSSFGSAIFAGNKLVTSGKKLDSITSMKINGTAVTYKINSASELEIELPKDLAPGKYDVEINSIHGKLTHLQGITIKAVVPTKEISFKADGAWLNYGSLIELTNAAKQIGSDYTSVKCIVNAADPVVAERLARRACAYIEANRLRGKAVTYESKSTYKGEGFWVKVVANG